MFLFFILNILRSSADFTLTAHLNFGLATPQGLAATCDLWLLFWRASPRPFWNHCRAGWYPGECVCHFSVPHLRDLCLWLNSWMFALKKHLVTYTLQCWFGHPHKAGCQWHKFLEWWRQFSLPQHTDFTIIFSFTSVILIFPLIFKYFHKSEIVDCHHLDWFSHYSERAYPVYNPKFWSTFLNFCSSLWDPLDFCWQQNNIINGALALLWSFRHQCVPVCLLTSLVLDKRWSYCNFFSTNVNIEAEGLSITSSITGESEMSCWKAYLLSVWLYVLSLLASESSIVCYTVWAANKQKAFVFWAFNFMSLSLGLEQHQDSVLPQIMANVVMMGLNRAVPGTAQAASCSRWRILGW